MSILEASRKSVALKHPLAALSFYMGNKKAMHEAIILDAAKYIFGANTDLRPWKEALLEITSYDLIPANKNTYDVVVGNNLNTTFGKWIWCCVRVLQPDAMIETGVAHGSSSWIILNAMHKNGKGKLFSIDLPNHDTNKDYNFNMSHPETGWMVPDVLKKQWELHLGYAQEILPKLLNQLGKIDIFFHDSDHSYEHMKFEFETSSPFIRKGGLMLSDDVHKNKAFSEYVERNHLKALQFNKGGCALAQ
ncbi:MAG: class I SAM-dependent methyltransferase [Bacteroidetes bacterium]|nr:class I SAM-dependent methyltransferase [Bacteroidota bacterium]